MSSGNSGGQDDREKGKGVGVGKEGEAMCVYVVGKNRVVKNETCTWDAKEKVKLTTNGDKETVLEPSDADSQACALAGAGL